MGRDYFLALKELFALAKPYWLPFSVAFAFLVGSAVVEVTIPQVVRHTIDHHILPKYAQDRETGEMLDITRLSKWDLEKRVLPERYFKTPRGFMRAEEVFRMPKEEILKLREEDLRAVRDMFLLFLLLLTLRFFFNFGFVFLSSWVGERVANDLRVRTFRHALRLPMVFYDRTPLGVVITRLTNDINAVVETFKGGFLNVFQNVLMFAAALVLMLAISVKLTLIVLLLMPVILGVSYAFAGLFAKAWRKVRTGIARINAFVQESIWGLKTVQNLGAHRSMLDRFREVNDYLYRAYMGVVYIAGIFRPAISFIRYVAVATVIWYSAGGILEGEITFGSLVAFLSYVDILFRPVEEFSQRVQTVQSSIAGYEKVKAFLKTSPEPTGDRRALSPSDGIAIRFQDVVYSYDGKRLALKGLSFDVRVGEKVALVGRTGAGKTTVLNLMMGFYLPTHGKVEVFGVDTREWDVLALRELFSPVLQDLTVFADSMAMNITFGYDLPFEDVLRDMGLGDVLGKSHSELSAGEKQLVAIARALAFNRPIIVFDEATSNIDAITESKIQRLLLEKFRDKTMVIVAHRLATARVADRILVLEDGRVVEEGSHEELLRKGGKYYQLYRLQEMA